MSPHSLLPLAAFALNVSLATLALLRNPGSRLNRVFAYFASGMALWNFGVFLLRTSAEPERAFSAEVLIHVGVIAIPAFYYHFILIFLDATTRHRPSLVLAYAVAVIYEAINLSGTPLFMSGVTMTYWGWAPATGPLYLPYFLSFNAFMVYGLYQLVRANRGRESSFRRNRSTLILLGTLVSLAGGFVDFTRFILARFIPAADLVYPVGIPANMVFALMLGTSIVRYRLFPVGLVVKKAALYACVGVVVTALLAFLTQLAEAALGLRDVGVIWIVAPLGLLLTLFLSPLGQRLDERLQRLVHIKRHGAYETLLQLSKRMSGILNFNELVDSLVEGLVQGIPATHATLMVYDAAAGRFVSDREASAVDEGTGLPSLRPESPIVHWLEENDGLLVKEEAKLNPRIARYFEAAEGELEAVRAALIVPLKVEGKLNGILFLGEKLGGDIYDDQELDMLLVLATQAAIALENARLYENLAASNARLMEASRLKSQFLASMSHELRTPLNSIIGFSKVLLNRMDGELTERQEAYVRSVHNSSRHLLELINTILDFSRIEAGRFEMRPERVDLHDLIEECLESALPLARDKRVKIDKDVAPDLPPVTADRMRIKQVLLNLLSNAVKFTHAGRVVVSARPEDGAVHVAVADTGIGIAPKDLERLFEPFQRLDNPLAQQADGTGLGLAISKKFVELHRGRIWAESREGHGSTFHFTLPVATA